MSKLRSLVAGSFTCIVATTLLAASAAAQPAPAQPAPSTEPVQAKVDRAMAYYEASDLAHALEELTAAYALEPRSDVLFAIAQIHNERGDCAKAIVAYRQFLATGPGPSSTRQVTAAIATCKRVLAGAGEQVPEEGPTSLVPPVDDATAAPVAPAAPAAPPHAIRHVRPWYTDTLGDALTAAGVVGLIGGGVLHLSARTDVSLAGARDVGLAERAALLERADRKQLGAGLAVGLGAALVIGGVVRYVTGDRTEAVRLTPITSGGATGAALDVGWRF